MRNPIMTHLRGAVRAQIAEAFEQVGQAQPRAIARAVCQAYPEDIQAMGAQLAENALTDVARQELKRRPSESERRQFELPGLAPALAVHLPTSISVPAPEAENPAEDDEEAGLYKPLARATLADVEAHLQLLSAQIAADTRRHRALKELADLARAAGALADAPLFDVLASATALREVA